MKQFLSILVAFTITTTAFSQAGQKWSTSGNANAIGDFIGATNNQPLIFKTNNTTRGLFTATGSFQLTGLTGTGARLLQTDASGTVSSFSMGNSNEVLFGDGMWKPLPFIPTSFWEQNDTNLYYISGKVGIGTKTPFTNFDVIGDAFISNNLYVGGGIIITEKINANVEVVTAKLKADSIVLDSTKAIYGYSIFKDQVRLENKLQVVGNTQIDGNFRVNGDFIFGSNKRISYLPASGGNPEIIGFGGLPIGPSLNPCVFPITTTINQFQGMIQTYGVNAGFTNVMSMGFDGANGIIDMAGTSTGVAPRLLINYNCGKDIFMNTGVNGGNVIMTNGVNSRVGIGTSEPLDKFQVGEGINKINIGFLGGDENSDCITSYLGFNAAKTSAGWVFNSNGHHNGGAVIMASSSGQLNFIVKRNPNGEGIGTDGRCSGLISGTSVETLDNDQLFERTKMVIIPNGNVGIGTSQPQDKLQIGENFSKLVFGSASGGNLNYGTSYIGFNIARNVVSWATGTDNANNGGSVLYSNIFGDVFFATIPTSGATAQVVSDGAILNNTRLFIGANGKVGINTRDTKGYQFAVNGNMIAGEIVVKNNANWPDYVFNEEYPLKKLSDLEEFINTNKHLPNVPTEKEVKENGIKLGDMNTILLQKVEELTLYIIDLEKRMNKLEH